MRRTAIHLVLFVAVMVITGRVHAHVVDPALLNPSDFATEVVYYEPGWDVLPPYGFSYWDGSAYIYYEKREAALGAPTRMVRMENRQMEPVNPVLPAWEPNDVVSVGTTDEGYPAAGIILKFDHDVADDLNNPYGIDFIVFGNARFFTDNGDWLAGDNPAGRFIGSAIYEEPGLVSVSQTGLPGSWHTFASPICRRADAFAPTAARKWDAASSQWGVWLDPTRPIDPNLKAADFYGKSVAQAIEMYDGSAGGAGFDISVFGLPWIRYVKIEQNPDWPVVLEVDAVSDVSACGDYAHPFPTGDLNHDCRVNFEDMAIAGSRWVSERDVIESIVGNWLQCNWECDKL
jgi:hypothetical protein